MKTELISQEFRLLKVCLMIIGLGALVFMFVSPKYVYPQTTIYMYIIQITTILVCGLFYKLVSSRNYRVISVITVLMLLATDTPALLMHQLQFVFGSFFLVFTFITVINVMIVRWPEVLVTNGLIFATVTTFIFTPATKFGKAVDFLGLDFNFVTTVVLIFIILVMSLSTALVEIKRRTEKKLRHINENLNDMVTEKVGALRKIDREKRAYEEQIESIFHHIPVGVIIVDNDLNYLYTNGVHFNFKIENDELVELSGNILPLHVLKENVLDEKYDIVVKNRKDLIGQRLEYSGADGSRRIIRYSYVAVNIDNEDEGDSLFRLVLITEDITHEEALRDKLIRTDHLAEMGKMAASLAHEINNPLAGIKLYLELLEQGGQSEDKQTKIFNVLDNSIGRIDRIIKGFLTFARQDKPKKDWVPIPEVINETLEIAVGFKPLHHIHITPEFPDDLPQVSADRFKLGQVFLNLINNAKDAMQDGGTLNITASHKDDNVYVMFKDTGKGIKKEDLPHIFTPFYTTKERGRGTGLGLSTCYGIIQEHGGSIEADSREGAGTTFVIKLPVKS